jgi:hypothetical protein
MEAHMIAQDLMPKEGPAPKLFMGVWITFNEEDGAALIHLLMFLTQFYSWTPVHVKSKQVAEGDSEIPLAQDGEAAICLRALIAKHLSFDATKSNLPHHMHIGFRDEHRGLFYAYLAQVEKMKADIGEGDTSEFADALLAFYKDAAQRYFPARLN